MVNMSAKSQADTLMDVRTNSARPGNESAEDLRAKAATERMMAGDTAEFKKSAGTPQLREKGRPARHGLAEESATEKSEGARLTQGQLVEVRSAREIAQTLDNKGRLQGVPFMPEMAVHCGRTYRVFRRADITCVEGHGLRRMNDAVFLEDVRCDGSAHDGCQRRCLIFWKEAWLKPVDIVESPSIVADQPEPTPIGALANLPTRENGRYLCQSTVLVDATEDLPSWNLVPFISQVHDGELTVSRFLQIVALALLNLARKGLGFKEVGRLAGLKSKSSKNDLGLQPGEWVKIKSPEEIEKTLDAGSRNRGLIFEPEMSEYCGKFYQMDFPIKKMIHEETGKMIQVKNTVALKGLTCQGLCAKSCPRSNYWFWREDWLERVPNPRLE